MLGNRQQFNSKKEGGNNLMSVLGTSSGQQMRDAINQERDELVRDNQNLPRDSEMSTG